MRPVRFGPLEKNNVVSTKDNSMIAESTKPLPENLSMLCYVCNAHPATHLCKYKVGEMSVQVCLCRECMQIDSRHLLEQTIGIKDVVERPSDDHLVFDEVKFSSWRQTA
jgi:hypothetical protein